MRPLAKDLGISHATLIHHFGSKEQLLTEVVATLRDSSSLDISSGTDIVEMLTSYWNGRTSAESLPNFRLMFEIYGQALLHPERYREFLDHVVGDWLGGLAEAALAHGCPPDRADRYATIVLAQIRGLTLDLVTTVTASESTRRSPNSRPRWALWPAPGRRSDAPNAVTLQAICSNRDTIIPSGPRT